MPKITDAQYVTGTNGTGYIIGYQDGIFCRWPVSIFSASKWLVGSGYPNTGLGDNDDYYLDTDTGDVYTKASDTWGSSIVNIKGADGAAGVSPKEILYSISGLLSVSEGKLKRYISTGHILKELKILLGAAATGNSIKFDILKNGTAHVFTSDDFIIPADITAYTINTFTTTTLNAGDYLTVDITQVGSTFAGSNLTLMIIME